MFDHPVTCQTFMKCVRQGANVPEDTVTCQTVLECVLQRVARPLSCDLLADEAFYATAREPSTHTHRQETGCSCHRKLTVHLAEPFLSSGASIAASCRCHRNARDSGCVLWRSCRRFVWADVALPGARDGRVEACLSPAAAQSLDSL